MSDMRAIAHNTVLQIIGKALGLLMGIATIAVLFRYLGETGFGGFTTAITFLSLFAVVVDFGLTLTTVQMISKPDADEPKILGNLLGLRLITGIIVFAIAPLIGYLLPYPPEVHQAILVGAGAYFCSSAAQMLVGIFQKHLQMWRSVLAELVGRAVLLVGSIIVATMDTGIFGIMVAMVIGNALQIILTILLARPFVRIRTQIDLQLWKKIFLLTWPIGVSIFFNLIYLRGDVLLLSLLRSQSEVGLYGGAYKLIDVLTALPVMFIGLILPRLTVAWIKDPARFQRLMQQSFDLFAVVALPIAVGAYALAEPLMLFIGGPEFVGAGVVLKALSPSLAIVFFGALFGHAVVAVNKQRQMVLGYAVVAAISLSAYLILIPRLGMFGAAWVTILSESLMMLLTYAVVRKTAQFTLQWTIFIKAVAACALMYLAVTATPTLHFVIRVLLGVGVYTTMIVAVGGIDHRMIKTLLMRPKV